MSDKLQAIRGMHDILPNQTSKWQFVEITAANILSSYGFREIRIPIVEKTELFSRSIGELSDIVNKEMYTFTDRNGEQLTLRPEGTASCVRAGIEHGLFHNQTQKLWYIGPMFRHERPQKGRQRQFHQIGAEAFGFKGPDIDAEMILICARLWRSLDLTDIKLQLNTLGTAPARNQYREKLIAYFKQNQTHLDEDSLRRLETNPLRILDSKNSCMQEIISAAPVMNDHLDQESAEHFDELKALLDNLNINYELNPHLVRGLDYYSKTVFEWVTDSLGAQGTICAGGRYDTLVEHFGGKSTPACGFALGLERLIELIQTTSQTQDDVPHVYFVVAGEAAIAAGLQLAESLRDNLPHIRIQTHCGGGVIKNQFKKADKSGAEFALILGDDELENRRIGIKSLRTQVEQETVSWNDLASALAKKLTNI